MELTGDLSDFPLTDILQILALSRKTGTLALEAGRMAGKIIIEHGRITQASLRPGGSFSDRLVQEKVLSPNVLGDLTRVGSTGPGVWTLESLLVESGVMTSHELELAARRHIQNVVATLIGLEKGRFGIALNHAGAQDAMTDVRLEDGVDIGEVLLEAAKEKDEGARNGASTGLGLRELLEGEYSEAPGLDRQPVEELDPHTYHSTDTYYHTWSTPHLLKHEDERGALFSFLAELRPLSFEAEVSLLVMRYASEVVNRGVLFVVKETEICGLGQFGIESHTPGRETADEIVREIVVPLDGTSIFDLVVQKGEPFIGVLDDRQWHRHMLSMLGGSGSELSCFALPILCNDRAVFILYGDNYPDMRELTGLDALVTLVNQASIVLEKIVLERLLKGLQESSHPKTN
jgi:hypothetical protein